MTSKTRFRFTILSFIVLLIFVGCHFEQEDHSIADIEPVVLDAPQVLIDHRQGNLTRPIHIDLIDENSLAVLDISMNKVLVYSTDGELQNEFGGRGRGSGEFERPLYFNTTNDHIHVIDGGSNRINRFDHSGNFVGSYEFRGNARNNTVIAGEGEQYYTASMGSNSSLLRFSNAREDTSIYFGQPMGEASVQGDLEAERQALANGELPPMYKNRVTIDSSEGDLYVFLNAYSRLQKYTAGGELIWDTAVDLELNELIFERLVERARNSPPSRIPTVEFIMSMKVIDGDTWLLWVPVEGHPRKLVKVDGDGNVAAIYHIPELIPMYNDFTIDPTSNTLFLTAIQVGQVYQVQLPEQKDYLQ